MPLAVTIMSKALVKRHTGYVQSGETFKETYTAKNIGDADSFDVRMFAKFNITKESTDGVYDAYTHQLEETTPRTFKIKSLVDDFELDESDFEAVSDAEDIEDEEVAGAGMATVPVPTVKHTMKEFITSKVSLTCPTCK